jgi:Family of unknown function (DUF6152)
MKGSIFGAAIAALALSSTAYAHHSSAPHYDASKPVRIEGTIKALEFVNPHSFLHISVVENGEEVVWDCEMTAASMLRRQGWTPETFVPGQKVTVNGIAARRDAHGCALRSAVLEDGTELRLPGGAAPAAKPSSPEPLESAAGKALGAIAGTWARAGGPNGPPPGGARRGPGGAPAGAAGGVFTAEGLRAQSGYDQRFDDPSFQCSAASIVRAWSEPGTPTEIELDGDRLTIRHEYMDTVRTVDMSTREHPQALTPTLYGHSVGWFEGSTLVIDTIGFTAGVLRPHPGVLHSDALHMVERLTADPEQTSLHVAWTADDAKYFTKPMSGEFTFAPTSYEVQRYNCTVEHANR